MLLLLLACAEPDDTDKPVGGDTAADTDTDTDTVVVPVDEDNDGWYSDVDCNDNAYQVYPEAPELCDGVDNDCDELVDEEFDADADGALSAADCAEGTDCDDADAAIGPDATETPYDDIDQDCSGADLTDVDGDGYEGGGGFDCDDNDASVHPNVEDVPKDGVDSDCDGLESYDGDGDGYDDADFDGDDCDDVDPSVHPGARDWWNDGLDTDCDDHDNALASLGDAPVTIEGDDAAQDLVGQDLALCDLDGDTLLDLVITAPFGESYAGQIGVFYGDGAATWGAGMRIGDADTLIQGSDFLGFEIGCADLDGDGFDDLVTGRGEIDYRGVYDTDFELVIWYGDGAKMAASVDDVRDADASLAMILGVPADTSTVYGRSFTVADLDDDGASEIVVVNSASSSLSEADGAFYVLGGGRYAGDLQLADEAAARVTGEGIAMAVALPDLDGDGVSELLFGENGYTGATTDTGDTGAADTGDTGPVYLGRASVVESDALADGAVGDLAYGFWVGSGAIELGFAGAVGDFDGDGLSDLALSALGDDTVAEDAGSVFVFAPVEGAVPAAGASDDATATLQGATEQGYFGYTLQTAGDVDGDGADDLLVGELYGEATYGRVWLVSGAATIGGAASTEAASLYAWVGEVAASYTGNALEAGDLDGDGAPDFVVAAYGYASDGSNANGKVYVLLSGG